MGFWLVCDRCETSIPVNGEFPDSWGRYIFAGKIHPFCIACAGEIEKVVVAEASKVLGEKVK